MTPVTVAEDESAVAQLRARGVDPVDVRWIFISHFHGVRCAARPWWCALMLLLSCRAADHISGLVDFPNATFVCLQEAFDFVDGRSGFGAVTHGKSSARVSV